MTKKVTDNLKNHSKVISKLLSYVKYKDNASSEIKEEFKGWLSGPKQAPTAKNSKALSGIYVSDTTKYPISFGVPSILDKNRVIYNTIRNDFMSDVVLIPVSNNTVRLIVSFAAQKKLMDGYGLALCNFNVKKLLRQFFNNEDYVSFFLQFKEGSDSLLINLASYMASFSTIISESSEGDKLDSLIQKNALKYELVRQTPFIKMIYYDSEIFNEKYGNDFSSPTDKQLIMNSLIKMTEDFYSKELAKKMLIEYEGFYNFHDTARNIRYLYSSQLYDDFEKFYNLSKFACPKHKIKEKTFINYLKELMEGFITSSAWGEFVFTI